MAFLRKALVATTMASAGLLSTTGAAFAVDESETKFIDAQGAQALNQNTLCDLRADVVPIVSPDDTDLAAELPILNAQGNGNDTAKLPNGEGDCGSTSTTGAVDSKNSDTADVNATDDVTGRGGA